MIEKYIKASECEKYFYEHLDDNGMIGAMNAIAEMPAADVQPVKRGKWELMGGQEKWLQGYTCSECGRVAVTCECNFCPNCGADMRGDENV